MTEQEQWLKFYDTVGGKYICEECGSILTWFQKDHSKGVKTSHIIGAFVIGIVPCAFILTPVGAGLFIYIYLEYFAPRRGCPICHAKTERIIAIDSKEGLEVFKTKHPEYAYLTDGLTAH